MAISLLTQSSQKHFRNTEKILLLINYFNFRAQPSVLVQVIELDDTSDSPYPS